MCLYVSYARSNALDEASMTHEWYLDAPELNINNQVFILI